MTSKATHINESTGPKKVDGTPDQRYVNNAPPGSPAYDSRHRNPHAGQPPPERQRHDRPVAKEGEIANDDGTLDMRFLENRIKAGLVTDPSLERKQAEIDEPDIQPHKRVGKKR